MVGRCSQALKSRLIGEGGASSLRQYGGPSQGWRGASLEDRVSVHGVKERGLQRTPE